ncbi:unnamed protein product [Cuscuta epithymum]|uniref:Uncharacterized protein n=1 Tax=Cuscuta epithymum TaxID=186058 RepID=A0AAV0GJ55_9ASTE|nr:unnamed protein product [Cuscuta epithymum]
MGKKDVVFAIAACFREACHHPFLVAILCFMVFLHRSFPCLFSLLLSVFPVIFCTFLLLGVLLSYSQPELPKTERDHEERIHTGAHFKPQLTQEVDIIERDDRSSKVQFGFQSSSKFGNDKCVSSCDDSKHVDAEQHEEEDDENLDSLSDRTSVVDIVPILDELHPLLDNGIESEDSMGEETKLLQDEDDEETHGSEGCLSTSAFKWTEEDEKNVMEVGSSELERNQILERVMERRKSRKCVSMMGVNELSSLESSSPQNNIQPHIIVTKRHNPFDLLSGDTYNEQDGLPPIPGSAPSVLIPRQNPFDIPYDISIENSQLDFQPKDAFYHRSRTFSAGPYGSCFFDEETSYSGAYTHSNDSKSSSVTETDSMGSKNPDDTNVINEDIEENKNFVSEHVGHGSESSEEDESLELGMRNIIVDEIVMNSSNSISTSSSSSSSEASERISIENEKNLCVDNGISSQLSMDGSELDEESGRKGEPVYDISPPRVRRNFSSSSIVFDLHEPWFPPVQVKRTVSFAEGVIMMGSNRERDIMSSPFAKEKTFGRTPKQEQLFPSMSDANTQESLS